MSSCNFAFFESQHLSNFQNKTTQFYWLWQCQWLKKKLFRDFLIVCVLYSSACNLCKNWYILCLYQINWPGSLHQQTRQVASLSAGIKKIFASPSITWQLRSRAARATGDTVSSLYRHNDHIHEFILSASTQTRREQWPIRLTTQLFSMWHVCNVILSYMHALYTRKCAWLYMCAMTIVRKEGCVSKLYTRDQRDGAERREAGASCSFCNFLLN